MTSTTIDQAARQTGIASSTMRRWLEDPSFRAELDHAQTEAIAQTARALAGIAPGAIQAIANSLSWEQPAALRLSGARLALDKLESLTSLDMLQRRLQALEEQLGIEP